MEERVTPLEEVTSSTTPLGELAAEEPGPALLGSFLLN